MKEHCLKVCVRLVCDFINRTITLHTFGCTYTFSNFFTCSLINETPDVWLGLGRTLAHSGQLLHFKSTEDSQQYITR